jgi:hypothetical protein
VPGSAGARSAMHEIALTFVRQNRRPEVANELKSDWRPEMIKTGIDAFIQVSGYRNILIPSKKGIVGALKPPSPALIGLCNARTKLLRRRLREEVVLGVDWQDGDEEAVISVVPVAGPNNPFETFRLRLPLAGLYVTEPGCLGQRAEDDPGHAHCVRCDARTVMMLVSHA